MPRGWTVWGALLVTGDQTYVDAWRQMIAAVNAHARTVDGRTEYPTMFGVPAEESFNAGPMLLDVPAPAAPTAPPPESPALPPTPPAGDVEPSGKAAPPPP